MRLDAATGLRLKHRARQENALLHDAPQGAGDPRPAERARRLLVAGAATRHTAGARE